MSPRLNGRGALAALWTGFVIGFARLILELSKSKLPPDTLWSWIAGINFLHFAALLFALCSAILIVVSFLTPPPAAERVADLTLQTATKEVDTADTPAERRLTIALSLLLALTIGVIWIIFR
jgi:SSS family solute:Na+ symporter